MGQVKPPSYSNRLLCLVQEIFEMNRGLCGYQTVVNSIFAIACT